MIEFAYNPFTSRLDAYEKASFRGVLGSDPTDAVDGDTYINSGNHTLYMYYGHLWQTLHVLTPAYLLDPDGNVLTDPDGNPLLWGN